MPCNMREAVGFGFDCLRQLRGEALRSDYFRILKNPLVGILLSITEQRFSHHRNLQIKSRREILSNLEARIRGIEL